MTIEDEIEQGSGRQPLDGLRVLDLTTAIGAYCTRLLGDLGAEVIKVEPPLGDPLRRQPPFVDSNSGPEGSLLFCTYHANKRGITLNTAIEDALPLLSELGATADVIVISPTLKTPVAGFDRDAMELSWSAPDAVVAAITPFGLTGPLRDWRSTAYLSYAMGGGMHRSGKPDSTPLAVPGQVQWDEAGLYATLGILSAVRVRPEVGGQLLDLSVHEVASAKDYMLARFDVTGMSEGSRKVAIGFPPTGTWRCTDGNLDISCYQPHHWGAFLKLVDYPEVLADPDLTQALVRRNRHESLTEIIAELLAPRSRVELFAKGQACGLPCNPSNSPGDFVADEQAVARHLFVQVEREGIGQTALPWGSFKSTPSLLRLRRPAPTLGEHNHEVFVKELGHDESELAAWRENGLV